MNKAYERIFAAIGLRECPECMSWTRSTKSAIAFHYRRCKG
jgi:hypothetical protein